MAFGTWLKKIERDQQQSSNKLDVQPKSLNRTLDENTPQLLPGRTLQTDNNSGARGLARKLPDGQEQHYKGFIMK